MTTSMTSTPSSPFFFNDTATTEIYTLSLHDALPISRGPLRVEHEQPRTTACHRGAARTLRDLPLVHRPCTGPDGGLERSCDQARWHELHGIPGFRPSPGSIQSHPGSGGGQRGGDGPLRRGSYGRAYERHSWGDDEDPHLREPPPPDARLRARCPSTSLGPQRRRTPAGAHAVRHP